jgi:hypothetical protein
MPGNQLTAGAGAAGLRAVTDMLRRTLTMPPNTLSIVDLRFDDLLI